VATLELHIVVKGDQKILDFLEMFVNTGAVAFEKMYPVEFEIAGGLTEKDEAHGEENSEGVPDGE